MAYVLSLLSSFLLSYDMSTLTPKYCPETGELHSKHPSSFAFCPACCASLQLLSSTQKVEKKDVIILDDSPDTKKAIFVPSAKTTGRTTAENARQQSIQRTSQSTARKPYNFPVLLHVCLVRYEVVSEGTWSRNRFMEYVILRTYERGYVSF